jgi:hypothetical protein
MSNFLFNPAQQIFAILLALAFNTPMTRAQGTVTSTNLLQEPFRALKPTVSANLTINENSNFIESVFARPERMPPASTIPRLSISEEELLIAKCEKLPSPTNKFGIVATLAFGGGERSAEYFRRLLESEFAGKNITVPEEEVLLTAARLLGVLGQRSTSARELLIRGTQMSYWKERPLWQSRRNTSLKLANNCIQGCGLLPDGKSVLLQLTHGGLSQHDAIDLVKGSVNGIDIF